MFLNRYSRASDSTALGYTMPLVIPPFMTRSQYLSATTLPPLPATPGCACGRPWMGVTCLSLPRWKRLGLTLYAQYDESVSHDLRLRARIAPFS